MLQNYCWQKLLVPKQLDLLNTQNSLQALVSNTLQELKFENPDLTALQAITSRLIEQRSSRPAIDARVFQILQIIIDQNIFNPAVADFILAVILSGVNPNAGVFKGRNLRSFLKPRFS